MKDNTNNKQFWNEYVTYWENKVREANSDDLAKDKTADDALLKEFYFKLQVSPEEKLLDYGCGFCRLYPIYKESLKIRGGENRYYGIDVSNVSLECAKKSYKELNFGESLIEFDGLQIPYEDNYFDKIICFCVFDTTIQEVVIRELLRVLKPSGLLLITGKNNLYYKDDEEALIAEINARKKEHPNSFTDINDLIRQLWLHDVTIQEEYYYPRRRDFALNQYKTNMPERFYQWALILKKQKNYKDFEFTKFSNKFSDTFIELEKGKG